MKFFAVVNNFHKIKTFDYFVGYVIFAAVRAGAAADARFLVIVQIGFGLVVINLAAGFDFGKNQRFAVEQHNIKFAAAIVRKKCCANSAPGSRHCGL